MSGYIVLGAAESWGLGCGESPSCSCGCGRPSLAAYRGLGALDPATAARQIIAAQSGLNASSKTAIAASAQAGQMLDANGKPAYIPGTPDCAALGSSGVSNVQLAQIGGGLALTGINVAAALSSSVAGAIGVALGPATLGVSAIIGLFPLLFGHHAAAVKKEQSVLCAAVPAANNYFLLIDQAVQQRQATPQQAIAALQSLVTDFQSQVSSIMHDCNAACVMFDELKAIALVKQSQYQDVISAAQASGAGVPGTAQMPSASGPISVAPVSGGGIAQIPIAFGASAPATVSPSAAAAPAAGSSPSWLPLAALVIGGFFLMRAL